MDTRGTFMSAHELLDLLAARQAELGLSNEALEEICEWPAGYRNKYLGPSREKFPGILQVSLLMDALGLSGTLYVDAAKVKRAEKAWQTQGKRKLAAVRSESQRVNKAMLKRAAPAVRLALAASGGLARWAGVSAKERAAHVAMMNAARLAEHRKRLASKRR